MKCLFPIKLSVIPKNGLSSILYSKTVVSVPCGKCVNCCKSYSLDWSVRCYLESRLHDDICCITLTFNDENLHSKNLDRKPLQKFIKRLRKFVEVPIRYFGCGEYGSNKKRPHYHLIIFGYSFPDVYFWKKSKKGNLLYRSPILESLWKFGFSTVEKYTFESGMYFSKYYSKLIEYDDLDTKPFTCMSLKPSIGFSGVTSEEFSNGFVYINGHKYNLPRSYYRSLERSGKFYFDLKKRRLDYVEKLNSIRDSDIDYKIFRQHQEFLRSYVDK